MSKRKREDEDGSLDSLLDTMTNVVGILVIVLVVTQLGVGDAVDRISESESVDPQKLAEVEQELAAAARSQKRMQDQLDDLKPVDTSEFEERLAKVNKDVKLEQTKVDYLEKQQASAAKVTESLQKQADQVQKKIDASENERKRLQKEVTETLDHIARMEAILAKQPEVALAPDSTITLPNPRPAPPGASSITFLCAYNRVYELTVGELQKIAQEHAAKVVRAKGLDEDKAKGIPKEPLIDAFKRGTIGNDHFAIELKVVGRTPRIALHPRRDGGFELKSIQQPLSAFSRRMVLADKSKYYGRFLVKSDSFEAYVASRRVATQNKFLAGWEPINADYVYETSLGGPIRVGPPPPPPKPKPPTKPPVKPNPKPNPKPPPKPPTKKPKPPNVID